MSKWAEFPLKSRANPETRHSISLQPPILSREQAFLRGTWIIPIWTRRLLILSLKSRTSWKWQRVLPSIEFLRKERHHKSNMLRISLCSWVEPSTLTQAITTLSLSTHKNKSQRIRNQLILSVTIWSTMKEPLYLQSDSHRKLRKKCQSLESNRSWQDKNVSLRQGKTGTCTE